MRKIHVLTRKEEVDAQKIRHCTAVVIDVLLATSTIAAALYHRARDIIPVADQEEALQWARTLPDRSYVMAGEKGGHTLGGFLKPCPVTLLRGDLAGKSIIFSTTNGTVAIKKSMAAKTVYTSSLVNGSAVAKQIYRQADGSSIVIVCGGSHGRFASEDFLGAGYLITELVKETREAWSISDSAKVALQFYQQRAASLEQAIRESDTGRLLSTLGYDDAIRYVARAGCLDVVPRLVGHRLIADVSE
ncbi:2-phosphosulfolactate phosphatase [Brevibacillus sp. TJ4]|uniref:2-phosphosulfolactate phosphatase n=1 Tax=Brevibacillus sp. TJ4 TaxID=3234853 RepID=UPI0037D8020A